MIVFAEIEVRDGRGCKGEGENEGGTVKGRVRQGFFFGIFANGKHKQIRGE